MGLLAVNIELFNQLETEAIEARGEAAKYLDPDYCGHCSGGRLFSDKTWQEAMRQRQYEARK